MADDYKTPGVYIKEIALFPPSVAQVETAIPAFIGYTEKALDARGQDLVLVPTRIRSLLEYEQYFGRARNEASIEVTMVETTAADGTRVSLEATAALSETDRSPFVTYYALQFFFENGGGPCYIVSAGTFADAAVVSPDKDELKAGLDVLRSEDEPTLIVFPEGMALDAGDYYDLQKASMAQCAELQDRFAVMGVVPDDGGEADAIEALRNGVGTENLKYGAVYYPRVATNLRFVYDEADVTVTGLAGGDTNLAAIKDTDTLAYNVGRRALDRLENILPAAPAVVGIFAQIDATRGVWKAPANVALNRVIRPLVKIDHQTQADLNVHTTGKSINVVRSFTGRGTLIWGARTLAGNDNEWRYVNVRRFFNMVEESVKKATESFVFEPNDANTWAKVRGMIENFLLLQWRAGALAGAKPEHAFFVKVGLGQTMTSLDILEGRMIVEIGMAVVRPAEFIILRFSHKMQES